MGNDRKRGCCFGVLSKRFVAMLLIACALVSATLSLCGCYVVEGPSGNDGAPGTVWRSGTSYNEFSDANIGDYFIDTDDYVLYQKSGMGWIVVMENYGRGSADAAVPSITINADGYWCVGGVSTGVMARGEQGVPGAVPEISVVDGYWHVR